MKQVKSPDDLEDEQQKHAHLVVCYGAKWCAPCKAWMQIVQDISTTHDHVQFVKVDIDVYKNTFVRRIPTTKYFKKGQHERTWVGKAEMALRNYLKTIQKDV